MSTSLFSTEKAPLLSKGGTLNDPTEPSTRKNHRRSGTETTNIVDSCDGGSSRRLLMQQRRRRRQQENVGKSLFLPEALGIPWFLVDIITYSLILGYSLLITIGPLCLACLDRAKWCPYANDDDDDTTGEYDANNKTTTLTTMSLLSNEESPYDNPDYSTDPCRYTRLPYLLFLTLEDCDISRRMLTAVFLGGLIGYERRSADRPAGIRTMGLVSLGACFFTISSIMAFKSSTMGWDASRVTAALPSGVGFLGGALIWKGTVSVGPEGQEKHQVHGLTTAASLWLSAAIGVGAGGALYAVSVYSTGLVLLVLRYGPKMYGYSREQELDEEEDEHDDQDEEEEEMEDLGESESLRHENLSSRVIDETATEEPVLPPTDDLQRVASEPAIIRSRSSRSFRGSFHAEGRVRSLHNGRQLSHSEHLVRRRRRSSIKLDQIPTFGS